MIRQDNIQEYIKRLEKFLGCLKPLCFDINQSKGRRYEFDSDIVYSPFFDPYELDRQSIVLSKSYRRTGDKKQVVRFEGNSHVRKRDSHTDEVEDLAFKAAVILGLNPLLCRAIAVGHDTGHTPFGHTGESYLSKVSGKVFRHYVFGSVLMQHIERKGRGLNLLYEVLEGIVLHSRGAKEMKLARNVPQEYNVVMYSDKIAYTFADINDMIRIGKWKESSFPKELKDFGYDQRERVLNCLIALVEESADAGYVIFQNSETAQKFAQLRKFMYENVYSQLDRSREDLMLEQVYEFISNSHSFEGIDPVIALALMTDTEVKMLSTLEEDDDREYFLKKMGIMEIIQYIRWKDINWSDKDLKWGKTSIQN